MSDPPVITVPGLDCTPEMQAERILLLRDQLRRAHGGVTQVSDRNRSVTYQTPQQIWNSIVRLKGEIAACETGRWPEGKPRVYYVPQVKDL